MKESEMSNQPPDESTLHAWGDGELQPESAAAVAQWLADHPDEAARMAAIQAQTAGLQVLHSQVLDEPVPPQLTRALRKPPTQWRWPHALAAAHAVYVPEKRHPVEVAAQQQAHLVQWLSKRLGVPLKTPVLEAQGFQLMGGRLLPGETGQARAQFMYEDAAGERLTLYVSVLDQQVSKASAPAAFQWSRDGTTHGFYWIDGLQGYALSADLPRERLQVLADAIYRQLD